MDSSVSVDVNYLSVYGETNATVKSDVDLMDVDGSKYASVLKVSHCHGVTGIGLAVAQATENALDLDFCDGVVLVGHFGLGPVQGDQVITIKGGVHNYDITAVIHAQGHAGYEVAVGNWFDQSYRIGGRGKLHVSRLGGGKVRVAIGWAIPFATRLSGDYEYMVWDSLKIKVYWILKFLIRMCLRIPKGTKGPAWF